MASPVHVLADPEIVGIVVELHKAVRTLHYVAPLSLAAFSWYILPAKISSMSSSSISPSALASSTRCLAFHGVAFVRVSEPKFESPCQFLLYRTPGLFIDAASPCVVVAAGDHLLQQGGQLPGLKTSHTGVKGKAPNTPAAFVSEVEAERAVVHPAHVPFVPLGPTEATPKQRQEAAARLAALAASVGKAMP